MCINQRNSTWPFSFCFGPCEGLCIYFNRINHVSDECSESTILYGLSIFLSIARKPESLWLTRMGKATFVLSFLYIRTYRGDVAVPQPQAPQAEAAQGMTINEALKEVLRSSRVVDGLARGLREAVKTLDK